MKILIIGGSASGKSEYAESVAEKFNTERYYIATMIPFDRECEKRIEKHKNNRKNKSFKTIEKYTDIQEIEGEKKATAMLECMSNLVANEMYGKTPKRDIVCHIVQGIENISVKFENLIVVSNDVFSDGIKYSDETEKYIKNIGDINKVMAEKFDVVTEVVCGIPISIKGVIL